MTETTGGMTMYMSTGLVEGTNYRYKIIPKNEYGLTEADFTYMRFADSMICGEYD